MRIARTLSATALAPLVVFSIACGPQAPSEVTGTQSAAEIVPRSSWDQWGIGLNGQSLDGQDLGQRGLVAVSYEVDIHQHTVRASLDGSALVLGNGHQNIADAQLRGMLDDGTSLPIVIDQASTGTDPTTSDVYFYQASYATQGGYVPLCGVDSTGAPAAAIALAGRWNYSTGVPGGGSHIDDPNAFTFACAGYALEKCAAVFGYKPWDSLRTCQGNGDGHCRVVSMADMHQACTRAVRADYCGDGTSYTVDGTEIDIYDGYGYRLPVASWPFEAEWSTQGARCAARTRIPSLGLPTCWAHLHDPACGSQADFSDGALLMNQDSQ